MNVHHLQQQPTQPQQQTRETPVTVEHVSVISSVDHAHQQQQHGRHDDTGPPSHLGYSVASNNDPLNILDGPQRKGKELYGIGGEGPVNAHNNPTGRFCLLYRFVDIDHGRIILMNDDEVTMVTQFLNTYHAAGVSRRQV